ncbi:MAG: metal-dependent hydrolase [Acidobacteria bacterium]|nr:metal-dependent hydrolase [Acidobacteriota bacterium]
MANHKEHLLYGAAAGAAVYLIDYNLSGREFSVAEFIGAALSGLVAAKLPDLIEPAVHPNHRSTFHSVTFSTTALPVAWQWTRGKREEHLKLADKYTSLAAQAVSEQEKTMWRQKAFWHKVAAGVLLGMVPGYASHLLADALTPKSLPLFG